MGGEYVRSGRVPEWEYVRYCCDRAHRRILNSGCMLDMRPDAFGPFLRILEQQLQPWIEGEKRASGPFTFLYPPELSRPRVPHSYSRKVSWIVAEPCIPPDATLT
jgi:hypothetical protein